MYAVSEDMENQNVALMLDCSLKAPKEKSMSGMGDTRQVIDERQSTRE